MFIFTWIKKIWGFLCKDRELVSLEIIFAKIAYTAISIKMIFIYFIFLKIHFIGQDYIIKDKILWAVILGWILTSIRIWSRESAMKRYGKIISSEKRNYLYLIPVYLINYPALVFGIYFFITELFSLFFGKTLTAIQMFIFAFILGFAIDVIWIIFWKLPIYIEEKIKTKK